MKVIDLSGNITRQNFEEVNKFQQISFNNREQSMKGFIEIPLEIADLRENKEIEIKIENYQPEVIEKYKGSKIVMNVILYNIDIKEDEFSYYLSAGGFVLRFTSPKEYDFGDGNQFVVAVN